MPTAAGVAERRGSGRGRSSGQAQKKVEFQVVLEGCECALRSHLRPLSSDREYESAAFWVREGSEQAFAVSCESRFAPYHGESSFI